MVAFFLCGTPSNHEGFQFVELGPAKLPGSPGAYLDKAPGEASESHRFEHVSIDGERFVEYCRTLRINPNDSAANRGAYVAVGCLIGSRLPMRALANCVDIVSEIYGGVCSALRPERSFPPGYRLSHYEYRGAPLEERLAYQSSPLLLADVLLQAVNNEGSFAGAEAKPLVLTSGEVIAADVARYELYSAEGALEPLLSMEKDRSQILELTKYATHAAATLSDLRNEWSSLEEALGNGAARVLAKSEALRRLAGDMERAVEEHLSLKPESHDEYHLDRPAEDLRTERRPGPPPGVVVQGRASQASRGMRGTATYASRRSRRSEPVALPRWAALLGYGLIGVALAVLLSISWPKIWPPVQGTVLESAPVRSPAGEPGREEATSAEQPQQSDVARERAALDAVTEE